MEPEILFKGKAFHKRVQNDWELNARGGDIYKERRIELFNKISNCRPIKKGRLDIFVDEHSDYVSVVEIKSTDWDKIKNKNRKKLLGSHRRQVWRYLEKYLKIEKLDVCPGIIYPKSPETPGLKEEIEEYLNDYGMQVVWYDD